MPSPLELPSPSPVQESDDASIDDESSLSPEDEDDTENEEEHEMDSSLRPTSFVLDLPHWRIPSDSVLPNCCDRKKKIDFLLKHLNVLDRAVPHDHPDHNPYQKLRW